MNPIGLLRDLEHHGSSTLGTTLATVLTESLLLKSQRGLNAPELQQEFERTSGQTGNIYVNYTKEFGNHNVGFMVGTEKQVLKGNQFQGFRNGYISAAVESFLLEIKTPVLQPAMVPYQTVNCMSGPA